MNHRISPVRQAGFRRSVSVTKRRFSILTKEEMPACPVATTVQLIGSKWKLLILRNLRMRPWRFNELRRDLEGVSQKVLTDSLRAMEEWGKEYKRRME